MFNKLLSKKIKAHMSLTTIIIIIAILLLAWVAVGYFASKVEKLPYTVLSNDKEYEVRQLPEHVIAETTVKGDFNYASGESFRILAGYIFGQNKKNESISMTSPVIENESQIIAMTAPVIESQKIAMTGPVISNDLQEDEHIFSFVMPSKYTIDTLPAPLDSRVKIKTVESKKIAVLRFSGFYNGSKIEAKKQLLKSYLKRDGLEYSTMYWAGYNPPWTPPFMRRLEVWAEIN